MKETRIFLLNRGNETPDPGLSNELYSPCGAWRVELARTKAVPFGLESPMTTQFSIYIILQALALKYIIFRST